MPIASVADVPKAIEKLGLPIILKPVAGAGSLGVRVFRCLCLSACLCVLCARPTRWPLEPPNRMLCPQICMLGFLVGTAKFAFRTRLRGVKLRHSLNRIC